MHLWSIYKLSSYDMKALYAIVSTARMWLRVKNYISLAASLPPKKSFPLLYSEIISGISKIRLAA